MAENTAQPNPSPEEPVGPNAPREGTPEAGGARKGKVTRKKRRWPFIVGGIFLFLILVLVFAPTLLSIGPARSMVLGVVNDSLNGKVEVADWSLGWNSGISVDGLKVYEDKEGTNLILQASHARTELSLLKALKSGFTEIALGRTDVDNLDLTNLHVDEQGVPNIAKLPKASKKKEQKTSEPIHLSGDVHVNNMTGNVSAAGVAQKLRINPSDLSVKITGLNDPIDNDVKLAFVVEDPTNRGPKATPGTITLKGKADLFDQDKFDLAKAQVDEKLNLADVNLAALNPFLAIAKVELELGGVAAGAVDVGLKGASTAAATGEIKVANFQATGKALKEDVFRSNLTIPIKVVRTVDANNVAALKVDDLRVQTDYGYVAINADATQESLERLAKKLPPGREGHLSVTADFAQAAKLLESLRNTLQLEPDVKFESAKVYAQAEAWLYADRVVTKTQFNVTDVAATNKGGRVTLEPVTSTIDVTYSPAGSQPFAVTQLRDVGLSMASGFATINGDTGKGGTLAQFKLAGNGDFGKLQRQLAQFADLGKLQLQGTWNLVAATNGDPSKEDAVVNTNVKFTATNLVVAGIGDYAPIHQPWLDVTAAGNVNLKGSKPDSITGAAVVLKSNSAENPTVDLQAKGDVDLNTYASKRFDVTVKAALAKARDEFGAVVPALNYVESGQLGASVSGSFDGKNLTLLTEKPLAVKVTGLSVRQGEGVKTVAVRDQSLDVTLAGVISMVGDDLGADVKTLTVSAPKLLDVKKNDGELKVLVRNGAGKKQITGNGGVTVFADAKRLSDMAKSFEPPATQPSGPDSNVGQLTRALVNGTLAFRRGAEPVTTVDGNFTADVGVTTAKEPINDKIAIMLTAAAPDDLTQPLKAGLNVKSNTVNAAVSDAVVVLARQLADQTTAFNGPLDLLRSAKVSVTAERLEMLQAMADSFSPAAKPAPTAVKTKTVAAAEAPSRLTGDERISADRGGRRPAEPEAEGPVVADQPLPPLRVLSGRMVLNANVAREGQATTLKDTTLDVSNLSFRRGDGFYEARDRKINLKLAAAVETPEAKTGAAGPAISRVRVQELAGDLGVGRVALAKPIAISNLAAAIPTVDGGIQLSGALGEALRMLEAFQGAKAGTKYPYAGDYDLTQNITTEGNTVRLAGTIKATKFRAFDPNKPGAPTFSEDLLTVTNDLSADTKMDTATIKNLLVNMESTGALRLAVSDGQLVDWADQRKIAKEIQAKLRVDWPKLWTIVRPMLDPETQDSLKDLQLAGVMEKTFIVSGSFPATGLNKRGERVSLPAARAVRSLAAYGGVAFDRVSVNGIDVRDLDLPVSLEAGVLYVQDASKPKGQRYPKAFACNGGEIDLGGVQVDLTRTGSDGSIVPWITIPDANKVVLKNVAMNPLLADSTVGNYVNPGFSGPNDARGRVTLTNVECKDVPLDWFTAAKKQTTPGGPDTAAPARKVRQASRSDGRAEFLLAISEMELKAPLLPLLIKGGQVSGEVKKGHIVIENGIVKSDIPIVDEKGRTLMAWNGSVNLQDRRIINFNTGIAKELLNDLPLLRNNQKSLPAVLNVPISGPFDKPKVDLIGAVTSSIIPGAGSGKPEDLIKGLGGILEGNKKDKDKDKNRGRGGDEPRSSADDGRGMPNERDAGTRGAQPEDPVGNLLDLAGGLLNGGKSSGKERNLQNDRDTRDVPPVKGTDRIGDERISSDLRTNDAGGERRVSGDEPIGSPRGAAGAATTRSTTTAPVERNVSGRTKAQRSRDGQ